MHFKFPFSEAIGIVAAAFLLGGMFICSQGWLDGRWMALFIGLPFIVFVIPELLSCEGWKGLLSIPLLLVVFGGIMLVIVFVGDWLLHNQWLLHHQWIEPSCVIVFFCFFVIFLVNRR